MTIHELSTGDFRSILPKDDRLISKADYAMVDLVKFLKKAVDETSYRAVADKTGVSKGSIENIVKETNTELPTLETFMKLSEHFELPLWYFLKMADVDIGLPSTLKNNARKLASFAEKQPKYQKVIDYLLIMNPSDIDNILDHLEGIMRRHLREPIEGLTSAQLNEIKRLLEEP